MQSVPKPLSVASLLASGSGCPSHPPSSPLPFCPSPLKRFHLRVLTLLASVAGFQVTFRFWPMGRQPDNPSLCPGGLPSSGSQAGGGGGRAHRSCSLGPGRPGGRRCSGILPVVVFAPPAFPFSGRGWGVVARCCYGSKQKAGLLKVATCSRTYRGYIFCHPSQMTPVLLAT